MTSEELIASIRRRANPPGSQYATSDYLALLNEEQTSFLAPFVKECGAEFFVWHQDLPFEANVLTYPIPSRAIGGVLRAVSYIESDGTINEMDEISQRAQDDLAFGYTVVNQSVFIVTDSPASPPGTTLRLTYFLRPSTLVETTAVRTVLSFNAVAKAVTLSSAPPAGFTSSALYDLVNANPGHEPLGIDMPATVAGSVLTFTGTLPADLETGDYVCLAGQTPVPQVPPEFHPLLSMKVTAAILRAMGDKSGADDALAEMKETAAGLKSLIQPRVEGDPLSFPDPDPLWDRKW